MADSQGFLIRVLAQHVRAEGVAVFRIYFPTQNINLNSCEQYVKFPTVSGFCNLARKEAVF